MIIEFLREFIGSPPVFNGISDIPALVEYTAGVAITGLVISSIYMVFTDVFRLFSNRRR